MESRVIDKQKIVEEVSLMFPLLTKDHFLYATLDRHNWDVNSALDTLQKRHDNLQKQQKQIEQQLEEKKRVTEKKEQAFKEVKDIFGDQLTDAKIYGAIAKYRYNVELSVNYLMQEISIIEEVKRRKDAETLKKEEEEKRLKEELEIKRQEVAIQDCYAQLERLKREQKERFEREAEENARKEREAKRLAEVRAQKEEEERKQAEERDRLRLELIKKEREEVERAAREKEEEQRILSEEREKLREMVEEQEKRIQEMLKQKKIDEEKKKQYQDRINSILLELKSQPTEYKKEIASSELFQDLLKDFQSVLKLSDSQDKPIVNNNNDAVPVATSQINKPELVAPFGFTAPQSNQDVYKPSSPFQNITKHPFYYNPFSDPLALLNSNDAPFVPPSTPPSSPPPSYPFTANFPVVSPLPSPPFAKPLPTNPAKPVAESPLIISQVAPDTPKKSREDVARVTKRDAIVENLCAMFSATSPEIVGYVWEASNGDISVAIQNLLDINAQK